MKKKLGSLTIDEFVKLYSKPCLLMTANIPCPDFRRDGQCMCDFAYYLSTSLEMEVEVDE